MATIYDIANLAGVSASSVSRVINGKPGVNKENRKKIEALLRQHNYVPDANARSLVRQDSRTVCVRAPAPSWEVTAGSNAPTSAFANASVWYWTCWETPYAAFAAAPKNRFVTNALPFAPMIHPPAPNTDQPAKDNSDRMRPPTPPANGRRQTGNSTHAPTTCAAATPANASVMYPA